MKKYVFKITEVDTETGIETPFHPEEEMVYTGFTLLADGEEKDHACCMIVHDSIGNIAAKIGGSAQVKLAAKFACMMEDYRAETAESDLMSALMGLGGDMPC